MGEAVNKKCRVLRRGEANVGIKIGGDFPGKHGWN